MNLTETGWDVWIRFVWLRIVISDGVEVRKCLLSFGAESFVFQVVIQKFKD